MDRVPLMAHSKLASRPTGVETFAMGEIVISSTFYNLFEHYSFLELTLVNDPASYNIDYVLA